MKDNKKDPEQILTNTYNAALSKKGRSFLKNSEVQKKVEYVCGCMENRAGVRLLASCLLAKIHNPAIDPRKPYTEINEPDSFSGRTYDEKYITKFVSLYSLPVNSTTAYLTPALRNISKTLSEDTILVGRPKDLYITTLQLLAEIAEQRVSAQMMLSELIRQLIILRDENREKIESLLLGISSDRDKLPLSSEGIITLISQHLKCKNASRLPVLIIAAAYMSVAEKIGENALPLNSHNAADLQTGSLGDIKICLVNDEAIVTAYEMKLKRVTFDDIDTAKEKISRSKYKIDNYLFITTEEISPSVSDYALNIYEQTGGTEIAILDCIGFLRSFLHLFHRNRMKFIQMYQDLVLSEPDSAVSQTLKEVFLILRKAAEADSDG